MHQSTLVSHGIHNHVADRLMTPSDEPGSEKRKRKSAPTALCDITAKKRETRGQNFTADVIPILTIGERMGRGTNGSTRKTKVIYYHMLHH